MTTYSDASKPSNIDDTERGRNVSITHGFNQLTHALLLFPGSTQVTTQCMGGPLQV